MFLKFAVFSFFKQLVTITETLSLLFYFNMYHGHESQMAPYMTVQIARHKPSKGRSPGRLHKRGQDSYPEEKRPVA
jgi:hypothetical protein